MYQQFENHVLQVTIMSRTVDVNPLTVLVSVLVGVELFGFLGALLAIPVAGIDPGRGARPLRRAGAAPGRPSTGSAEPAGPPETYRVPPHHHSLQPA